jgi:Tol biopolymer transport system component
MVYESVTGRRAFQGNSEASLIAAILGHVLPPISSLQPTAPQRLDDLVTISVAKDPENRWQSMRDVLLQLRGVAERADASTSPALGRDKRLRLPWMSVAIAFLLLGVTATVWLMSLRPVSDAARLMFDIDMSPASPTNLSPTMALSPDGKQLAAPVFSARGPELRIRSLDKLETHTLANVSNNVAGSVFPFWSPDNRWVAYFADGKLLKADLAGNPPQAICDTRDGRGGTWNRDGVIVFAPASTGPLFQISAVGGSAVQATELDSVRQETAHHDPNFLPDGRHFLYVADSRKPENIALYVGSLGTRERKRLLENTSKALFAAPSHLVFFRDSKLLAQRFDPARLTLAGDPFVVAEQVASSTPGNGSVAGFTVSDQGTLAYRRVESSVRHLVWFERSGTRLGEVGAPSDYGDFALSPDLRRVAVSNRGDIWLLDLVRGGVERFTVNSATDAAPVWSADGGRIAFQSNRNGRFDLFVKALAGGGDGEGIVKSSGDKWTEDWSPDGRVLLYTEASPDRLDLWTVSMTGDRKPQRLIHSDFISAHGRFSADGRWIAYVSTETGRAEIYVQNFPLTGRKWKVSTAGGAQPRWRKDGSELFFMSLAGEAMAVDIRTSSQTELQVGTPRKLFQANPVSVFNGRNSWDVTPDGQRFLINSGAGASPITVVVNWAAALNR